jgi:hypothetical protein
MIYENDDNVIHVIRQVRLMNRYFHDADVEPYRDHHAALHVAYMDLLQEEIAPYALELAQAVVEWEEWAIERRKAPERGPVRSKRSSRSIRIADAVTRQHAETFAEVFLDSALSSEAPSEAFGRTALMVWPGEDDEAALDRYDAIADEIRERTFAVAKRAISEAFFVAASEVLARERNR